VSPPADTVLLVEDAQDLGPLLLETLEEWNHSAVLAQTGAEALTVLDRQPVSLVLLDHELPDMTGSELLGILRSQKRPIPPVVLLSVWDPGTTETSGVVEVLHKPFDLSELAGVLRRHLPGH